jgi:hypothetical protein
MVGVSMATITDFPWLPSVKESVGKAETLRGRPGNQLIKHQRQHETSNDWMPMKMEESATPFSRPDCLLLSLAIRILRSRRVDDLRFRIPDESALPIDSPLFFLPPSRSAGITLAVKVLISLLQLSVIADHQAVNETWTSAPDTTRSEPSTGRWNMFQNCFDCAVGWKGWKTNRGKRKWRITFCGC